MSGVHAALQAATPGSSVVYHVGARLAGCKHVDQVRRLYDAGRVELVQRRVDEGFAYIAQFRRNPIKLPAYWRFADAGLV